MSERKRVPAPKVSCITPSSRSLRQASANRLEPGAPCTRTKAQSQLLPGRALKCGLREQYSHTKSYFRSLIPRPSTTTSPSPSRE